MKKKILKVTLISLSVLVLLTIVLCIHIYIVTRPHGNQTQLSRIDFKEKIDSAEAKDITGFISHLEGVQKAYFNISEGVLIYGYTPGEQNSTTVYNDLMQHGNYKAVRYVVNPETVANGCPVFDKNSLTYRISSFISKLFN